MGEFRDNIKAIISNVARVVLDKTNVIKLALTSVLAGGHVLMEDVPGTAKTVLVKALAISTGCKFTRIQCTPDLLPSDISGVSVYNQKTQEFEFRPGPIFSQMVVADEINRATPRTQSALLEAMAEGQVSVDGKTYKLEQPFIVFATQNPVEHEGTFPLPEAQLDRFMMRLSMGYPSLIAEAEMIERQRTSHPLDTLQAVTDPVTIRRMQAAVREITVHEKVREYMLRLIARTRDSAHLTVGASPRATLALFRATQAFAAVQGRSYAIPDDVKALAHPILEHRLILNPESRLRRVTSYSVLRDIISEVSVPTGSWIEKS
ncbi:MAG TPA: MoxR family ATPase [Candidatus Hydrogenedentes bacterium]|nr:MoxR family ATPase [Candidatus Hydrogenedentota bacterium]HOL75782.1 MoxR family ATPase [Candidatus Hydrogenedentota bacterium]HPO84224.1 MoxR family ATPase [Candidatus Hydrogenedentota bacterium]